MRPRILLAPLALALASAACTHQAASADHVPIAADLSLDALLESTLRLTDADPYLAITRDLLCHMPGPDGRPIDANPSAVNEVVPPAKIFDNLYYIGGTRTGSWLITTPEGYIMIDGMYGNSPETVTIPGMIALGLDPAQLKYLVITHAGPDHAGGARYYQEHYGTRIIMSQQDWDGLLNPAPGSWVLDTRPPDQRPPQQREWRGPPSFDIVAKDGDSLTLGGLTMRMFFTPRTARGGGLSFIVPVTDMGDRHVWATYGNTGLSQSTEDRQLYRASVQRFLREMESAGVDSITSSHPFVDGSNLRMAELNRRLSGMPNPFVIGSEAAQNYLRILDECAALVIARNAQGLDDAGLAMARPSS